MQLYPAACYLILWCFCFSQCCAVTCDRWSEESSGVPSEAINHSPDAVLVAQYSANFFVQQARKSSHFYSVPEEEDAALIYNFAPTKTNEGSFVQTYFFDNKF